jgi:hypothetical protein
MTKEIKNIKIGKAIEHINKAIVELQSIESNFDDYKDYANKLKKILSSDHGEAGLLRLLNK